MSRSTAEQHKEARRSYELAIKRLDGKKIDLYSLFYLGFRSGINRQRKHDRQKKEGSRG